MSIDPTILIYSHTSYEDILLICMSRIEKYMPWAKYAVCINNKTWLKDKFVNFKYDAIYEYDESTPYATRLICILSQVKDKYVIFLHDNNVLVDFVQKDKFISVSRDFYNLNGDQLRLFYGGVDSSEKKTEALYCIKKGYFYSVSPALWKRESLLSLMVPFKHIAYREIECNEVQNHAIHLNTYLLRCEDDYLIPGEGHYYSHIFPLTHVTREGKWVHNSSERDGILESIFEEFKIDRTLRGMFNH